MRILVTGGAGFIGSHVVDRFLADGHEVAVLDNLSTGTRENLDSRAELHEADVRDEVAVRRVVAGFRPEVIDHHAAQIDVRRSVNEPGLDAEVNLLGSLNLLEAARANGVKKIVYASTGGALYGEARYLPADEQHPINPESPYGASKHALEHYLYLYKILHSLDYTVLRYPNVYGPRQNPHGEAGVNAIFIAHMLEKKRPTIFGDGDQVRDYLYVDDVVEANALALERGGGELLNLGWGKGISVNEIFATLREILEFPGEPIHAPPRAGEVQRIYLKAERARQALGWSPRVEFREGLRRTVAWHRSTRGPGTEKR